MSEATIRNIIAAIKSDDDLFNMFQGQVSAYFNLPNFEEILSNVTTLFNTVCETKGRKSDIAGRIGNSIKEHSDRKLADVDKEIINKLVQDIDDSSGTTKDMGTSPGRPGEAKQKSSGVLSMGIHEDMFEEKLGMLACINETYLGASETDRKDYLNGIIFKKGMRNMLSVSCQSQGRQVDTGAQFINLTQKAERAIFGSVNDNQNHVLRVNGVPSAWFPSTAQFAHVNLLGQQFLKTANLMIIPHWESNRFTLLPNAKMGYYQKRFNVRLSEVIGYKNSNVCADLTDITSARRVRRDDGSSLCCLICKTSYATGVSDKDFKTFYDESLLLVECVSSKTLQEIVNGNPKKKRATRFVDAVLVRWADVKHKVLSHLKQIMGLMPEASFIIDFGKFEEGELDGLEKEVFAYFNSNRESIAGFVAQRRILSEPGILWWTRAETAQIAKAKAKRIHFSEFVRKHIADVIILSYANYAKGHEQTVDVSSYQENSFDALVERSNHPPLIQPLQPDPPYKTRIDSRLLKDSFFVDLFRLTIIEEVRVYESSSDEEDDLEYYSKREQRKLKNEELLEEIIENSRFGRMYGPKSKLFIIVLVPDVERTRLTITLPFLVDSICPSTYFAEEAVKLFRAASQTSFNLNTDGIETRLGLLPSTAEFQSISVMGQNFLCEAELSIFIDWNKGIFKLHRLKGMESLVGCNWEQCAEFGSLLQQATAQWEKELHRETLPGAPTAALEHTIDELMAENLSSGYVYNLWHWVKPNAKDLEWVLEDHLEWESFEGRVVMKGKYCSQLLFPLICLPCRIGGKNVNVVFLLDLSWHITSITRDDMDKLGVKPCQNEVLLVNGFDMGVCLAKYGSVSILGNDFLKKANVTKVISHWKRKEFLLVLN